MRTALFALFAAALVLSACDTQPPPRPDTAQRLDALKLDEVVVPAIRGKPVDTGALVYFHDHLDLTAEGAIRLGAGSAEVGPAGLPDLCGEHCPVPDGHRGALIALVQEAADVPFACVFEVGAAFSARPKCQGRLFLSINDDSFIDNSGSFTARFDTARFQRGSTCRRDCVLRDGPGVHDCTEACKGVTPEDEYCNCIVECGRMGRSGFESCMADNCQGVPDLPADCRQACGQLHEATLRQCMDDCPAPDPMAPCRHTFCYRDCIMTYHAAMLGCVTGTCGVDGRPHECLLDCYGALGQCLDSYDPDQCEHYIPDCLPILNSCAYHCAREYFDCQSPHPDCDE